MKYVEKIISVRGLCKEFGGTRAVDDVSFDVLRGRITGFLGPNGAGKTTTLRMVLGLIRPTSGSAQVCGSAYRDLPEPSRRVGWALDGGAFVAGRTGRNHLRCYAGAAGCPPARLERLLEDVGLTRAADRPVGGYSTGMKQRLALATAMLGSPELLVLDEPMNGLDPEGILWLRQFLRDFSARGGTVLLSSHLLGELEHLVHDVVLVHRGRLLCAEPLGTLLHEGQCLLRADEVAAERARSALAAAGIPCRPHPDGRLWSGTGTQEAGRILRAAGLTPEQVRAERCDLESAFIRFTMAGEGALP